MFDKKKNPCNIIVSYRLPALCQYSHHCYHLYLFIAFTFIHALFVSTTWNHLLAHLLLHTVSIKNTQQSLKLGKQGSNKSREDDFHIYIYFLLPTETGWGVHLLCLYHSVCEEEKWFFFSVRRAVLFNMSVSAVWLDMRGLSKKKIPEYRYSELPMKKRGDPLFPKPVDNVNTHT